MNTTNKTILNSALSRTSSDTQRGFTLLELLVVVAVIGILASLSVTSYRSHLVTANRQAAVATLQLAQQIMERNFLRNSTYAGALSEPQLKAIYATLPESHTFLEPNGNQTTYVLTATPTTQTPDPLCGTLTINQSNLKTISGTGTIDECWD